MMKNLVVVRGTMGAGKTAVCQKLLPLSAPAVWLDGDWCWQMAPFDPNEENRRMVMDNVSCLLRSFLQNSGLETVIFCWVLHQDEILQQLIERLKPLEYRLLVYNLILSPQALEARLTEDVRRGLRQPDIVARSLARLPLYRRLAGTPVDVSEITPEQAAKRIRELTQE